MDPLTEARILAGLSVSDVCRFFEISERTWWRWIKKQPSWALRALRLLGGFLDDLGWQGWRVRPWALYAPDVTRGWTRGDLYAQAWERQLLAEFQQQKPGATLHRLSPLLCRRGVPIVAHNKSGPASLRARDPGLTAPGLPLRGSKDPGKASTRKVRTV